ncbi:MAG: hypothetical protein IAE82_18645 [Opitutaceae bacterium]|nr:hypothetical protein [Opitutaceae bacterium]
MAKSTPTLEWCVVRLGDDMNWWVEEVSDTVHWDTDGLSIIDPRQVDHLIELIDPLRDYGFDPAVMERAFIPFRIDKDLGKNRVRIVRVKDSILESDEKLFALPDILDDENSLYADFLDHITRLRVKMLNDLFDFEQKLSVDEVEDEIREEDNADFMEGKAVHLYNEILNVLEYMPAGWESDEDDDTPRRKKAVEDEEDENFPDVEEDDEALKGDESLKWDEDEEEAAEEDEEGKPKPKGDDDEDEDSDDDEEEADDDEEDEAPRRKRGRR